MLFDLIALRHAVTTCVLALIATRWCLMKIISMELLLMVIAIIVMVIMASGGGGNGDVDED